MRAARRASVLTVVLAILALLAALSGCGRNTLADATVTSTANAVPDGSGGTGQGTAGPPAATSGSTAAPSTTAIPPVATVTATPALNSKGISPSQPISVKVDKGTFDDVTLTNPQGKIVDGELSADNSTWSSGEVLGFGKTYTLSGSATGTDGRKVPVKGTFTTAGTNTQVRNTINPADNAVVGVAAPISVSFGVEPQDKALIERNVSITTEPEVEGSWGWVQHDDGRWSLDYRTKEYWPADTKVHVEAKIYGLKLADNAVRGLGSHH